MLSSLCVSFLLIGTPVICNYGLTLLQPHRTLTNYTYKNSFQIGPCSEVLGRVWIWEALLNLLHWDLGKLLHTTLSSVVGPGFTWRGHQSLCFVLPLSGSFSPLLPSFVCIICLPVPDHYWTSSPKGVHFLDHPSSSCTSNDHSASLILGQPWVSQPRLRAPSALCSSY